MSVLVFVLSLPLAVWSLAALFALIDDNDRGRAWTPLFPSAAAIIVEVGSYLSHAGTVAREYQIPCLVDVEACTRRLRTGQRVRVFASEGRVEVVE